MIHFGRNMTVHETVVRFSDVDVMSKTQAYLIEMIVTKLADQFVQEHGTDILKGIDIETLRKEVEQQTLRHLVEEKTKTNDEAS